ncbi:MAG TPA: glutamyl-tRNA reductase [Verrucomicrobiota bacterium]|nr:glutamyl-tRNA reductase [Verrucomicrobiota bacterium]HRT57137.1 glutamyl-tRNA reductase [Candidatus Paceibacterota bacterium]
MKLFVAGLSYKTAPVEIRERLAVHASRLRCHGCRLKLAGNLSEVVLVSTCNRVEVYGVTNWAKGKAHRLFQLLSTAELDFTPYLYIKEGIEAVEHLFAVAGGLDSMVIGETEITGQVKQAYLAAQEAKLTGRITNRLFQAALQTAKRIRTETCIGRGATSVGSVAVELAERIFDHNLSDKSVMIIGAGKMGEACIRHLAKKGIRSVIVANRSPERARLLADEFGGRAVGMGGCLEAMAGVDIVVTSTGAPQTILHRDQVAAVMAARRNRPLFLIDIAVPRDVAPEVQDLPNVYLYNVDHLETIVRENVRLREQELARCHTIIQQSARELMQRFDAPSLPGGVRAPVSPPAWDVAPARA